jgi:hypothetical protein
MKRFMPFRFVRNEGHIMGFLEMPFNKRKQYGVQSYQNHPVLLDGLKNKKMTEVSYVYIKILNYAYEKRREKTPR